MPRGLQNRCGELRALRVGSIPTSSVSFHLVVIEKGYIMGEKQELLRRIPKIDEVLRDERLIFFMEKMPRSLVVEAVREEINIFRKEILEGNEESFRTREQLLEAVTEKLKGKQKKSLRRVINATGVVLHTNLGRANLSGRAAKGVEEAAGHYSNLEYDIKKGSRGLRHTHVEEIIKRVTGAEAAMVVNNNAAATMLCLSALARGKEVIVSRGELVEIGGSFRIPEIMEESGAILRDVGTTNKTKPSDYQKAYEEGVTGALLKVHTSNYKIIGFTQETEIGELAAMGRQWEIPVIYDLGSGLMVNLEEYGITEPTVQKALKDGADVVLFSGDKLLGGPQGGILAGKKELIDKMKAHPLARAFRVDKMTLSAMEATFYEYLDLNGSKKNIPVLHMITMPKEELKKKAEALKGFLEERAGDYIYQVEACQDQVGGGSAPGVMLPGYAVSVKSQDMTEARLERLLRRGEIPIITHVFHDKVYCNVRTIEEEEFEWIARALCQAKKYGGD